MHESLNKVSISITTQINIVLQKLIDRNLKALGKNNNTFKECAI